MLGVFRCMCKVSVVSKADGELFGLGFGWLVYLLFSGGVGFLSSFLPRKSRRCHEPKVELSAPLP